MGFVKFEIWVEYGDETLIAVAFKNEEGLEK